MSDEKKKPTLSPKIWNKLMRSKKPHIAQLEGPGPFQLPLLTAIEGVTQLTQGRVWIELGTETAQGVRILLTEQAASELCYFLEIYFDPQTQGVPDRIN